MLKIGLSSFFPFFVFCPLVAFHNPDIACEPAEKYLRQFQSAREEKASHGDGKNSVAYPNGVDQKAHGTDDEYRVLVALRFQKDGVSD